MVNTDAIARRVHENLSGEVQEVLLLVLDHIEELESANPEHEFENWFEKLAEDREFATDEGVRSLEHEVDKSFEQMADSIVDVEAEIERVRAIWTSMSFIGRMRWLFTGRLPVIEHR